MEDILLQILFGILGLIPVLLIFLVRELRYRKKSRSERDISKDSDVNE